MVLVATQSGADQGAYGLASNLGSLVVRTLFQPFEEAAFLAFAHSRDGSGGGGGAAEAAAAARLGRVLAAAVRAVTIVGASCSGRAWPCGAGGVGAAANRELQRRACAHRAEASLLVA